MLLFFVVVFLGVGVLFLFFGTKPGDLPYVVYIYIYFFFFLFWLVYPFMIFFFLFCSYYIS